MLSTGDPRRPSHLLCFLLNQNIIQESKAEIPLKTREKLVLEVLRHREGE